MIHSLKLHAVTLLVIYSAGAANVDGANSNQADWLRADYDQAAGTIRVFRSSSEEPILTQHARPDFRPYIHPIVAPDGRGVLTEARPEHHRHQTGLYWGFTRVNGRDFFHHPDGDYWRRVSVRVLKGETSNPGGTVSSGTVFANTVQWQTVYDQLDEDGNTILTESQIWTMRIQEGAYLLDLQWTGDAKVDVTIGKYDYGGLFLRMPWRKGMKGEVINSARQSGPRAEGQRAVWVDVGLQVPGREDLAHVAIFDHPSNAGFPQPWRVDHQMGIGPVRARLGDWKIAQGERARFRHQVIVYTGTLDDVKLTDQWSEFSGHGSASVQWRIAQEEGRQAEFLTPDKAVAAMTLPDGFAANVYASEPMITQPMAFCWDDRGRLWIAENRDYESRGRGFSNSGDSRILILEDTDRDGVADRRNVFLEGIPFPAAIAVGFGGLWLGAPPNLLFVPDRDGDDRADGDDIQVRLTGWGIRDRHETINSIHWGPDGWLYGCQGFATPSQVGKPAGNGRIYKHRDPYPKDIQFDGEPVDINGGVWRYHPVKRRFEVVAHGFSNPWGIDYDAKGQIFITACVIPHLWHVIPGGIYHRQGGVHFNPHVYTDIRTIADHRHRSAHGGARVYLSDAFPAKYKNRIFMANIHEHAVLTDILQPRGSGFVGQHGDDFLLANNAQWIGFSVEIGPDGGVYVLDWHDADICGKEVLNKETGRVFRITPKQSHAREWDGRYGDLCQSSDSALVDLQTNESAWHARRARLILQDRATDRQIDASAHAALRDIYRHHANVDFRLRAMWALHVTNGLDDSRLLETLCDEDQYVRAWGIQLLCEDTLPPTRALEQFALLARSDDSPVVRLYLASALQRVSHEARWLIANELVRHAEDSDDHNIPKMIWFGVEPMVAENPDASLQLAVNSRIPLITRHIARRLTSADQAEQVVDAVIRHSESRLELLLGLRDGLEGQYDVKAPANWAGASQQSKASGGQIAAVALGLSQQFGDTTAAQTMLATLKNNAAGVEARRQAIQGLSSREHPGVRDFLVALLDDESLRRDAIRAMASFDDIQLAKLLLRRYSTLDGEEKLDAILTLSARSRSGRELTQAIRSGDVPKRDIPPYVARLLRRVVGNGFVEVWGPVEELTTDHEAQLAKYYGLLTDDALSRADASRGRAVFKNTCSVCHKLYGEGESVGPDITGANRSSLEYILGNVLTPSAEIQDDYKMQIVLTDRGRIYSGIPAEENEQQLKLHVANEAKPVVIAKSRIESRDVAAVSMMPNGLLRTLTDQEVVDLVAYLRTKEQVPLPNP